MIKQFKRTLTSQKSGVANIFIYIKLLSLSPVKVSVTFNRNCTQSSSFFLVSKLLLFFCNSSLYRARKRKTFHNRSCDREMLRVKSFSLSRVFWYFYIKSSLFVNGKCFETCTLLCKDTFLADSSLFYQIWRFTLCQLTALLFKATNHFVHIVKHRFNCATLLNLTFSLDFYYCIDSNNADSIN